MVKWLTDNRVLAIGTRTSMMNALDELQSDIQEGCIGPGDKVYIVTVNGTARIFSEGYDPDDKWEEDGSTETNGAG